MARLAHLVVGGMGGKDAAQKIKFSDLMPFKPSEIFGREVSDCTPRTRTIIDKLIKTGKLPLFLMSALIDELDE